MGDSKRPLHPPNPITNPHSPPGNAEKTPADDVFNEDSDTEPNPRVTKPRLQSISIPAQATNVGNRNAATTTPAPKNLTLRVPNLPYDDSASTPASPSPQPPRKSLTPPDQGRPPTRGNQDMQVDAETPTATAPGARLERPNPPVTNNEPVVQTGSMSALLANNEEYLNALKSSRTGPRDPLEKYMKGELPKIYSAYPASAFLFVEPEKILEWDTFPDNKLIALPFGVEARQQFRHNNIRARLLAAVVEITNAQQVGVAAPGSGNRMIKNRRETPIAFLIHSLTRSQYLTLLNQKIWISSNIAFQVVTMKPSSPDYLFSLLDLATVGLLTVRTMIQTMWNEDHVQAALREIAQMARNKSPNPTNPDIPSFLETLRIERHNVINGDIITPMFNIYAKGALIQDDDVWTKIRKTLSELTYESAESGRAKLKIAPYDCGICHGADHPGGLCTFPTLPDWKGPSGLSEAHPEPGAEGYNRPSKRFYRR